MPNKAYDVAVGDLDGNGSIDIVYACPETGMQATARGETGVCNQPPTVWINNGAARFTWKVDAMPAAAPGQAHAPGSGAHNVRLADLDSDGDLDMIVASPLAVFLNSGSAVFTQRAIGVADTTSGIDFGAQGVSHLAVFDADGDGDLDIIMCQTDWDVALTTTTVQGVTLLLNDGTAAFVQSTSGVMPGFNRRTFFLAVADLDGDGAVDVVTVGCGAGLSTGLGTGTTTTAGDCYAGHSRYWGAGTGGTGWLPRPHGRSGGPGTEVESWRNDGNGGFTRMQPTGSYLHAASDNVGSSFGVTEATLVDIDGDGDVDIFLAVNNAPNRILMNDGSGVFDGQFDQAGNELTTGNSQPLTVVFGDIDSECVPTHRTRKLMIRLSVSSFVCVCAVATSMRSLALEA